MALLDAAVIFVASLLVGTVAILAGVRLIVDADAGVSNALFTALVGAIVWAVSSALVDRFVLFDWLPILGVVLMLVAWIGVLNWRYPGGWGTAAAIGFVAWVVAVAIVYAFTLVDVLAPEALGIPGA